MQQELAHTRPRTSTGSRPGAGSGSGGGKGASGRGSVLSTTGKDVVGGGGAPAGAGGGVGGVATTQGPFDEELPVSYRLLVADCSSSDYLEKRYRFSVYPLFLGFYANKLVLASTALAHRSVSKETMLQQVRCSRVVALAVVAWV